MFGLGMLVKKVFGIVNDWKIKVIWLIIVKINVLELEFEKFLDENLKEKIEEFCKCVVDGENLDKLLLEVFVNCCEVVKCVLGLWVFDVQLMGGIFLYQGNILEMKIGEGKIFVVMFLVYLNVLIGCGVYVVIVNDYLVCCDVEWMSKVFVVLGMIIGVVVFQQFDDEKKVVYVCDVIYLINNELGFDYLCDNMKFELLQMFQCDYYFVIVDEVDLILIDEVCMLLIILGFVQDCLDLYKVIDVLILELVEEYYIVDEKIKQVMFIDDGNEFVEGCLKQLELMLVDYLFYDFESMILVYYVN